MEKELSGTVNVSIKVNENSDVVAAKATSGEEIFRKSAEEAVKKAKFKKLISRCEKKSYTGIVQFNFTKDMNVN